jgi:hypothetical protein
MSASPRHRALLVLGVAFVVLAATGVAFTADIMGGETKTVTLQVIYYGGDCQYLRDNGSLTEGTLVTVTGDHGSHIATGHLKDSADGAITLSNGSSSSTCSFTASVVVPENQHTYTFTPAGSPAGVTFTKKQLTTHNWVVGMSYGCPANLPNAC